SSGSSWIALRLLISAFLKSFFGTPATSLPERRQSRPAAGHTATPKGSRLNVSRASASGQFSETYPGQPCPSSQPDRVSGAGSVQGLQHRAEHQPCRTMHGVAQEAARAHSQPGKNSCQASGNHQQETVSKQLN